MGWYQDGFPGSPAQKQRNRFAWMAVGYSVVVGSLVWFFSPFTVKGRKAAEEGNYFSDKWWGLDRIKTNIQERGMFHPPSNKRDFMKAVQHKEKMRTNDYGAEIPEETIRAKFN